MRSEKTTREKVIILIFHEDVLMRRPTQACPLPNLFHKSHVFFFQENQIASYVTPVAYPVWTLNGWRLKGPCSGM